MLSVLQLRMQYQCASINFRPQGYGKYDQTKCSWL